MTEVLQHHRAEENCLNSTASVLGQDFTITYSLENAEKEDLFWEMHQLNVGNRF